MVFLGRLLSPLTKVRGTRASPWLDSDGSIRECAGSKASSLQKPLSPLQCGSGLKPNSCALIFSPPFPGVLNFCFFLKWQVSYPTLNKIKKKKILYTGKDK